MRGRDTLIFLAVAFITGQLLGSAAGWVVDFVWVGYVIGACVGGARARAAHRRDRCAALVQVDVQAEVRRIVADVARWS